MGVFHRGATPTAIYAWEPEQHAISRIYVWDLSGEHLVFDEHLDAFIGAPRALASPSAVAPAAGASAPALVPPRALATAGGVVPALSAGAALTSPSVGASNDTYPPTLSASNTIGVVVATAGGVGIPPVNDQTIAPPAAGATATVVQPILDAGGSASVLVPEGVSTATASVPSVTAASSITPTPAVTSQAAAVAPNASAGTLVLPPAPVATGAGAVPAVRGDALVTTPASGATGAGIVPALTGASSITAVKASATAAGAVPVITVPVNATVTSPQASATAAGKVPFVVVTYSDTFDRANNTSLGSDWTEVVLSGSGLGIVGNNLDYQGSTDGTAYAMRNGVFASDALYVRITAGGANSASDTRIMLGANAGATVFAYLNWFSNAIYFGRSTGAYGTITDMASVTSGISISAGTVIEFYRRLESGHYKYYVIIGGTQKIAFPDTSDLIAVGSDKRKVGLGLERNFPSQNSGSVADFTANDYIL